MTSVTVRAPAKINLHLGVGAPREDGYHPLVTVYQAVGLYDDVTARASADWRLGLQLPDWMERNDVPLNGENIVDRAADLLAAHHGVERIGEVHIAKEIPVAGGMAGGSADAAAALVALDRLWQVRTSDDDLLELAAQLGSDVPFALLGGTALGTGRGELVTPVNDACTWWWVVVPSEVGLSTPDVYRHFDRMFPDAPVEPVPADALLGAIAAGDAWALADALHNDLEAPAVDLRPELGRLIETGESAGALRGMVSGSGPTCVFLCGSADHARSLATDLGGSGHPVVLAANGPVAGAHLVSYA
ncbi:MAG: 4-diphosphocytidyl-2-C-methyl-D-erythritol kinase [Nocardioides sp.]|nr:4-diphosphocytidyl-2-C-methyl-D-erythritol kinase [Nocardioides sp.]